MGKQRLAAAIAVCFGLTAGLVACGGGSSGSPSSGPSGSTDPALRSAGEALSGVAAVSGATGGDPVAPEASYELQQVGQALSADLGNFAATTTVRYCGGADPTVDAGRGSVSTVNNDVDPVGLSTGDTVTVTYAACETGPVTTNGTRTYTVNALSGDPQGAAAWSLDTTRATDLTRTSATVTTTHKETDSVQANSADGVNVVTTITSTASHNETGGTAPRSSTSDGTVGTTLDKNTGAFTLQANLTSAGSDGKRTIVTNTPFSGSLGTGPTAGVMEVSELDAAGALQQLIRVSAQTDGSVQVEIDANGDGVAERTLQLPWPALVGIGVGLPGAGLPGRGAPGLGAGPGAAPPSLPRLPALPAASGPRPLPAPGIGGGLRFPAPR